MVFFCHLLQRRNTTTYRIVYKVSTQLVSTQLAITCMVHFHIICEYYNLVQCGSLDFALLIKQVTNPLDSNPYTPPFPLSHFNDDEIHFLTTTLPNAFKSSPMYPGALNTGIIFPSSLDPAQSTAFTQHYTQLLPQSPPDDSTSSPSSPSSSPSSPSNRFQKVPTTNIPFSIFVYLALLDAVMYLTSKMASMMESSSWFYRSDFHILFKIPNIPSELNSTLFSWTHWTELTPHNVHRSFSINTALHLLHFQLHKHIRFPIIAKQPLASFKSSYAPKVINSMVCFNISEQLSNPSIWRFPHLCLAISLFGVQLAYIVMFMLWSQEFNFEFNFFCAHDCLQPCEQTFQDILHGNIDKINTSAELDIAFSLQLCYHKSYKNCKADIPALLPALLPPASVTAKSQTTPHLPINYTQQNPRTNELQFYPILSTLIQILNSDQVIFSKFQPSCLLMIVAFIIRLNHDHRVPEQFMIALRKSLCFCHDLDPHIDFTIRSVLNLYLEHKCVNMLPTYSSWKRYGNEMFATLQPSPCNSALPNNVILSSNILPGINHLLASIYYSNSMSQLFYDDERQLQTIKLQSKLTNALNSNNTNLLASSCDLTILIEQMIEYNHNGPSFYRKQSPNIPATYPSTIPLLKGLFYQRASGTHSNRHSQSTKLSEIAQNMCDKLWCSLSYFFHDSLILLLSNNLYYINLSQDVLISVNCIQPLTDQRQGSSSSLQTNNHRHSMMSLHPPSIQPSTPTIHTMYKQDYMTKHDDITIPSFSSLPQSSPNAIAPMNDHDITIHSFSHPSTLLGLDPQLYCIPYMAIQHNFSRTLFHLISSNDWIESCTKETLDCQYVIPSLLYLNLLHTFLCKPIAILSIEKEIDLNLYAPVEQKSAQITLFQQFTSLTNNKSDKSCTSTTFDALKLWNCGTPSSTSPSTFHPSFSLSDQHPLQNILTNVETRSNPSLITYSCVDIDTQTSSSQFTLDKFCQTPRYKANLSKHAHLPSSVIKQLYYIYTEALILTIQGFSFAAFTTPLLNDPTTSSTKQAQTSDIGILISSLPGCLFTWADSYISLGKMDNLKTSLRWSQLTDFDGTIQQATQMFQYNEYDEPSTLSATMVQNDSYHQHIMDLYNNPEQMLYSFNPHRNNRTIFQRGTKTIVSDYVLPHCTKATAPLYILDQQRTGTIAIAYEWSSAMVQHSIELFIELLLNEGSWKFVSQIDFSDDKQPLAEEYVIDYIPRDRADWGDKDKWTSNIPPNCTDKDTTFPLYKQFVPTKYQAQIPTLATAAMCPSHPEHIPHSIYHPDNTTQEQRDALINHYDENPSLVPAFVFACTGDSAIEGDQLQSIGFKTPTRGHLPYFYNLSNDEKHELYQTFSFDNLTSSTLPTSSSSPSSSSTSTTATPTASRHKPLSLDINLTEYLNQVNNDIPLRFQQEMSQIFQETHPVSPNTEISLALHQEQLCSQSQYLIEHYSTAISGSNKTTVAMSTKPPPIDQSATLPPTSTITSQDIIDIFTAPSINAEYITPNTQHLYSTLPPSITTPQLLPATFTIPTSLLIAQIQAHYAQWE